MNLSRNTGADSPYSLHGLLITRCFNSALSVFALSM